MFDTILEMVPHRILSVLVVCAAGSAAAVLIVVLRFLRRGAARSWLGPAFLLVALLPVSVGAILSAWGLRQVAYVMSLSGMGGAGFFMALYAGFAEDQVVFLIGLVTTAGVSLLALALLVIGRRPAEGAPEPLQTGPMAVALVLALVAVAVAAVPGAQGLLVDQAIDRGPEGMMNVHSLAAVVAAAAGLMSLVLPAAGMLLALRAPRGAAPGAMRALALGTLATLCVLALATTVVGYHWLDRLAVGAMVGELG